MHINKVKTAIKVGDFILNKNSKSLNYISVKYSSEIKNDILKDNRGRVYLFTSDGFIKKIGGSSSTGGIKTTLSNYTSSMTGSPGKPRFILHLLIRDELVAKKKVEIFMIQSDFFTGPVNGLFNNKIIKVAAFKEMEARCREDYFKLDEKNPEWNFKENNADYPINYSLLHLKYHEKRLGKK